jgi:hypothetical protein
MTAAGQTVVPPAGTSRLGEAAGGSTTTPRTGQVTAGAGLKQGCQFLADLGTAGTPGLLRDEPEPAGERQGPDAPRAICAAAAPAASPPGLTAAVLAPHYAPSPLGPPLTRLRPM